MTILIMILLGFLVPPTTDSVAFEKAKLKTYDQALKESTKNEMPLLVFIDQKVLENDISFWKGYSRDYVLCYKGGEDNTFKGKIKGPHTIVAIFRNATVGMERVRDIPGKFDATYFQSIKDIKICANKHCPCATGTCTCVYTCTCTPKECKCPAQGATQVKSPIQGQSCPNGQCPQPQNQQNFKGLQRFQNCGPTG